MFGRVRWSVEAAQGDPESSDADVQDVLITLVGEVALNYVELKTLQSQLDVAEENLKTQQKRCSSPNGALQSAGQPPRRRAGAKHMTANLISSSVCAKRWAVGGRAWRLVRREGAGFSSMSMDR